MKKTLGLTFILLFALGSLAFSQDTVKIGVDLEQRRWRFEAAGRRHEGSYFIALVHLFCEVLDLRFVSATFALCIESLS